MISFRWIVTLCVALAIPLCFGEIGQANAQEVTLRLGHVTTKDTMAGKAAQHLAQTAAERSDDRIKIELYPNAQLGSELEMMTQVRLGTLDIAMIGAGHVAAIEPAFNVTELPFIWKDANTAWQILHGPIGDRMMGMLEAKGVKGLDWGVWGLRGIMTRDPVNTMEDLNGVKVRVIENPLYVKSLTAFGANPTPMAYPEVYSGLQQGTIDGVETNYFAMVDAKFFEVTKSVAVTDHIFSATAYIMNLDRYNGLPADLQKVLVEAANAGGNRMFELAARENLEAIDYMAEHGVTVTRPARGPFESRIGPVHDFFATMVGKELIEDILAAQK